jgi:hypothetical protein
MNRQQRRQQQRQQERGSDTHFPASELNMTSQSDIKVSLAPGIIMTRTSFHLIEH